MSDQNPQQNNQQNDPQRQNVPQQNAPQSNQQGGQKQGSSQTDTDIGERLREVGAEIVKQGRRLLKLGNRRQLIIRSRDNDLILQTPLTLAAVFGIVLLFRALPILIAAVVAALVFRVQIILHKTDGSGGSPN